MQKARRTSNVFKQTYELADVVLACTLCFILGASAGIGIAEVIWAWL